MAKSVAPKIIKLGAHSCLEGAGALMEPETINSTDLRTKTRDLMERVKFNGESFIVETFGRPMAVIISFEDFQQIKQLLDGRLNLIPDSQAPRHGLKEKRRIKTMRISSKKNVP